MTDPWLVQSSNKVKPQSNIANDLRKITDLEDDYHHLGFEDSFIQDSNFNPLDDSDKNTSSTAGRTKHNPLPDSETYLKSLERKLEKLKKTPKLVDALSEKRDDCMRSMLANVSSSVCSNEQLLDLEASITNNDSAVQNLYRQLHPVQPVTVGETVHIVKYDQLEEQRLETETRDELEENLPASR